MKKVQLIILILFFTSICSAQDPLDRYNVVWESPSKDYNGSMPIGNGDIGANIWVEEGGDLIFYISKTDAYSENGRLLKLGKLRVRFTPNPFEKDCTFKQELDLRRGVIHIQAANSRTNNSVNLIFRVDANNPVIRLSGDFTSATTIDVELEHWRTERTEASPADRSFYGLLDLESENKGFAVPVYIEPDIILEGQKNSIAWYHRNGNKEFSLWEKTLQVQGLEGFLEKSADPLTNLTFGALVEGEGLKSMSPKRLQSVKPAKNINVSVYPYTAITKTVKKWTDKIEEIAKKNKQKPDSSQLADHIDWWDQFWDRSWIYMDSELSADAYLVNRGYILQKWITACGGRGNLPIRFNGSIFTSHGVQPYKDDHRTPDYRTWGSAFWWQNTRLAYWPMISAGNYDMMLPLFKMYTDALPLAKYRVKKYYGFKGALFPETIYFWGVYTNQDYGWHTEEGRDPEVILGPHTRYEWQGGIELTAMMLEYYRHTLDSVFLRNTLLPFAKQITKFYDSRYKRDKEGKLVIFPANALEEVWYCTNPTPEIAGLKFILPQLVEYTNSESDKEYYRRLYSEIPPLETDISTTGRQYILPAREAEKRRGNCEKPECYTLFPYRLHGVGLPDLEIAKETFRLSPKSFKGEPRSNGWIQDPIFAACLGDAVDAKKMIISRSEHIDPTSRFPGFWARTYCSVPDQDHGGVNMIALQHMLMQTDPWSDRIHLCPAWPKEWNASFKLHAPGKTIVQGEIKNGKVVNLKVTPESRMKDIVNHLK